MRRAAVVQLSCSMLNQLAMQARMWAMEMRGVCLAAGGMAHWVMYGGGVNVCKCGVVAWCTWCGGRVWRWCGVVGRAQWGSVQC